MSNQKIDKKQKSFMLLIEPKKTVSSSCNDVRPTKPKIGFDISKADRSRVRERLIKELKEFGS